jgi:DNA polymerase alpha subunit B
MQGKMDTATYTKDNITAVFDDDFMSAFGGEVDEDTVAEMKETQKIKPAAEGAVKRAIVGTPSRPNKVRNGVVTPAGAKASPAGSATPGSSNRDYSTRQNAGKVELDYNTESRTMSTAGLKRPTVLDIAVYPNCVDKPYRHMFEKLRDRADVLDGIIDDLGDKMVSKHKLLKKATLAVDAAPATAEGAPAVAAVAAVEGETLAHVALPNQEDVTVVGRVCLDGREGKLNAASVVLEGSRETSNGARVMLDLSGIEEFSMFPGQIVAAKGTNTTGTVFTPQTVYEGAPLPMARTSPEAFVEHYFGGAEDGVEVLEVLVAAGPFTTTADMDFNPLQDLLDVIRRSPPDAVILLGPFVPENHPMVRDADMDMTYAELFDQIITDISNVVVGELKNTELVLIPSLSDVHHDRVYPQPPYQLNDELSQHEKIHTFSNPATFTIKEVTIGVTTSDVLFDLTKQETSRGQSGDRMSRLANHVLGQRSYCPIVPPPPGLNVVYDHHENLALPVTPDVMLLPSELRHFIKNVKGSLIVNPGKLSKHGSGGTYSRLAIHAPRRLDIPEGGRPIPHGVHSRTVGQVIRV